MNLTHDRFLLALRREPVDFTPVWSMRRPALPADYRARAPRPAFPKLRRRRISRAK